MVFIIKQLLFKLNWSHPFHVDADKDNPDYWILNFGQSWGDMRLEWIEEAAAL